MIESGQPTDHEIGASRLLVTIAVRKRIEVQVLFVTCLYPRKLPVLYHIGLLLYTATFQTINASTGRSTPPFVANSVLLIYNGSKKTSLLTIGLNLRAPDANQDAIDPPMETAVEFKRHT